MRHRIALPAALGDSFSLRQAQDAGIGVDRCDASDLHRPFRGIRSLRPAETFSEHVAAHAARMKPTHRVCGRTAARMWGLPLPTVWTRGEAIEVCVPPSGAPPKTAGVCGRRLRVERARTWSAGGIAVVDPIAALFTSAGDLTVPQAVVMLDALLTSADNYPGLRGRHPLATRDEIARRLAEWGRFPGCGVIRQALVRSREGVESPKETETRLVLTDAGFPDPVVQFVVRMDGRFVARVDLAYPALRIAFEYEGDGHRVSKAQWRTDIRRQRALEDAGWLIVRLTQDDLTSPVALIELLHRAIAARTPADARPSRLPLNAG